MEKTIAIMFVFGGAFWLLSYPLRALADRIRSRPAEPADRVFDAMQDLRDELLRELQQVRRDVAELTERMDFAERLLARHGDVGRLAPPR